MMKLPHSDKVPSIFQRCGMRRTNKGSDVFKKGAKPFQLMIQCLSKKVSLITK